MGTHSINAHTGFLQSSKKVWLALILLALTHSLVPPIWITGQSWWIETYLKVFNYTPKGPGLGFGFGFGLWHKGKPILHNSNPSLYEIVHIVFVMLWNPQTKLINKKYVVVVELYCEVHVSSWVSSWVSSGAKKLRLKWLRSFSSATELFSGGAFGSA